MAASTAITLSLQARDWEEVVGLIFNSADPDMQELLFSLQTYYRAQTTKPQGTDVVAIATTEDTLLKIVDFFYGNTVMNVTKDSGTSPFSRVVAAIRAANNVADNYITTQMTARDSTFNTTQNGIRKNGRKIILMKQYDNN